MMVQYAFNMFNTLWKMPGLSLRPHSFTFSVCALGENMGIMEFVANSIPLREWSIATKILAMRDDQLDSFIQSAAGAFVACYVLGIRDRHRDNLMIKDDFIFFELDFKHCFNLRTTGVDAPIFAIPRIMKWRLEQRMKWKTFKDCCLSAFVILRRNSGLIITLCRKLFRGLFSESLIEQRMSSALFLHKTESQACSSLSLNIDLGVYSLRKYLKNCVHSMNITN